VAHIPNRRPPDVSQDVPIHTISEMAQIARLADESLALGHLFKLWNRGDALFSKMILALLSFYVPSSEETVKIIPAPDPDAGR